jgi:hypothetical protein
VLELLPDNPEPPVPELALTPLTVEGLVDVEELTLGEGAETVLGLDVLLVVGEVDDGETVLPVEEVVPVVPEPKVDCAHAEPPTNSAPEIAMSPKSRVKRC